MKRVRENANPTQGGQGQQGGEEPTGEPQKKLKRAEMFGGARVVGWGTWDEWRTVRAWLGSSVPEEQQRGFRRIRAWRARAPLPLAIEATAALLETHAMDTYVVCRGACACACACVCVCVCHQCIYSHHHQVSAHADDKRAAAAVLDGHRAHGERSCRGGTER
jgi:hypothetical protein